MHFKGIKCFTVNMGRIRTKLIKKVAQELVNKYPEKLSADFSQNKLFLDELNLLENKLMRNRVAGYIVKVVQKKTL